MDKDIPTADPGELIIQYTPLIHHIKRRYMDMLEKFPAVDEDDLLQAGRIAIYNAQKKYDPEKGTFLTFTFDRIRSAMRHVLGFNESGALPELTISLDEPLTEDGEDTRLDFVPDKTPTAEEMTIAQDTRKETADAVRGAVDRLKNPKFRETIRRVWFDGQDKETAAAEMGIAVTALRNNDLQARHKLRRDPLLKAYAIPFFHVTTKRFNTTWTSATEAAVLWHERYLEWINGTHDPENVQTSICHTGVLLDGYLTKTEAST